MNRQGCQFGFLSLLTLCILIAFVVPTELLADGGHGVGITFPAGIDSARGPQVPADFGAYKHSWKIRIQKDVNVLLSDAVQDSIVAIGDQIQTTVDTLLNELDDKEENEFGFPYYDFALIYNYFSNDTFPYGQRGPDAPNVLFGLAGPGGPYPDSQRDHVDYYLPHYGTEASGGTYPSSFFDADEDPGYGALYHLNSLHAPDGPKGLDDKRHDWWKSGTAANLDFLHEYSHVCSHSNFQPNTPGETWRWDDELFATAAEYLVGTHDPTSSWVPRFDFRYDGTLRNDGPPDIFGSYHMKRLFAAYVL